MLRHPRFKTVLCTYSRDAKDCFSGVLKYAPRWHVDERQVLVEATEE
jgi:hypothetical protein